MCGRYVFVDPEDIADRFDAGNFSMHLSPTFNAAPAQDLPVVIETDGGEREIRLMHWGLLPRWNKPGGNAPEPINARAETIVEKPMFRSLVKSKRCIVPVSGYYEWRKEGSSKQPYYISVPSEPILGLAGLYDELTEPDGKTIASYTIITTPPNAISGLIHNRMPAILARESEEEWLSKEVTDGHQVERLLVPFEAAEMVAWPVSKAVGKVENNSPALIEPIGTPLRTGDVDEKSAQPGLF
jgi:putative SOS response-associated peptidase YedK